MKELLEALARFAEKPEEVGDNLFTVFASITKMAWPNVVAAGCAINALTAEAYNKALAKNAPGPDHLYDHLKDPTFLRLESCLGPAVARAGQLIAEAPEEQRSMLIESVTGRVGFITSSTAQRWRKTLGIATN